MLAELWPDELGWLKGIAAGVEEHEAKVRDEIRRYPEGKAWHEGPGGGLPHDWQGDSELATLRPHDWKRARAIRFYRVTSPRTGGSASGPSHDPASIGPAPPAEHVVRRARPRLTRRTQTHQQVNPPA